MTKVATEHTFTGPTGSYASGYDSTKTMLGQLIRQQTGATATDKYAGPMPVSFIRPFEGSLINPGIGTSTPVVIDAGNNIHWVFELESSSAATVIRKVMLSTFNTSTSAWTIRGTISVTTPGSGTLTTKSLAVQRHLYTTGTVYGAPNQTTITGTNTAWYSSRYAEGARIGFGSTDPNDIKTWYYIAVGGITSDSSLTITSILQTAVPYNSPYVIDELRIYFLCAGNTTVNSGLYVVKGITFDDFTATGTSIAASTNSDNKKECTWLQDAATPTNLLGTGFALSKTVSDTSQYCYVLDASTTSYRMYKYDVRAALTVSSGKSTSAFVLKSATSTSLSTMTQTGNPMICATPNHGPGAGVESIYIAGISSSSVNIRILRVNPNFVDGSTLATKFIVDYMYETVPFGGLNAINPSNGFSLAYMASIDRFIVAGQTKMSMMQYRPEGAPIERVFNLDFRSSDQLGSAATSYPQNNTTGVTTACSVLATCNGVLYLHRQSSSLGVCTYTCQTYAVPLGADWAYAAGTSSTYQNRLITPELATPLCRKFYRLIVNDANYTGSASLGLPLEPYRVYYRTGGISDNSGAWNLVQENGDLSGVGSTPSIQFMFEFRVAGAFMLSPKIYGVTCVYENEATDSHYQPSLNLSDKTTKKFAWSFANAFGGTVPKLYVKIYESTTNTLLIKDDTVNQSYGTFQKSTDGGFVWGSYNTTDRYNDTTYIRYNPTLLANNLKVRMVLTQ